MDMYTKLYCPKCKQKMLLWLGDWSRDTGTKAEAARCPTCNEVFMLGDQYENPDLLSELIETYFDTGDLDEDEFDRFHRETKKEMVRALLAGEEWKGWTLAKFLADHCDVVTGEVLPI